MSTLHEFSSNFSKSADLLNSNGNFIPNRLNNLSRAITYIADNKESLQAEFGVGDAAKINPRVAQALAAYNQWVPAFRALLAQQEGDMGRFFAVVKEMSALPAAERSAALSAAHLEAQIASGAIAP